MNPRAGMDEGVPIEKKTFRILQGNHPNWHPPIYRAIGKMGGA